MTLPPGGSEDTRNHEVESTTKRKGKHSKNELRDNEVETNKKLGSQPHILDILKGAARKGGVGP